MAELCTDDWGQCAISNQPSFHVPFIYAYFGEQEKSDYWLKRLCDEGFSSDDLGGFPGDEDNGSAALWYVFAQIGLYPICPGKVDYTVTKPLVNEVKINGKKLDLAGYNRVISYDDIMKQVGK
jgi:putative alpha-1,2-mannosidase